MVDREQLVSSRLGICLLELCLSSSLAGLFFFLWKFFGLGKMVEASSLCVEIPIDWLWWWGFLVGIIMRRIAD